jgi:hypothetical protein
VKSPKFLFILIILFHLLFPLQTTEAVVIINTTTSSTATALANQRKIFYDGTNYWAFYSDGTDLTYEFSSDGLAWTNTPVTVAASTDGSDFSLWVDGTIVYLAYEDTYDIKANRGIISTTTITWTVAATALDGTSTANTYEKPFISKDSNGKLWIAARYYNGTDYWIKSSQSTYVDDISSWGTADDLSSVVNSSAVNYASLVPLSSGQMYSIWIRDTYFEGKLYNGTTWSTTTAAIASGPATASDNKLFSATVDSSNNIHLVYADASSYVQYKKCSSPYDSVNWSAATAIDANASQDPNIVYNSLKNALMVFWKRGTDLWYRQWINDSWDTSPTDWISASAGNYLSSNYSSNVALSLAWVSGTASPYEILFDKLNANNSPADPSGLGPAEYIDGSENYDRTPTLKFTLNADPDRGDDTVRFQIQISLIADFTSLVVDYTSELTTPAAASFTVGQLTVTGSSYTTGSVGQKLDDGKYFWRIREKDQWGKESNWVDANTSGAFIIEASLSFTISGVNSGTLVAGVATTVTTTAASMAFGTLDLNSPEVAAHSFTVTTNARTGYTITIEENENLTKTGSTTIISDVAGTNASPSAWPSSVTYSRFGYHTTDSSLGTGTTDRFLANDTWAALTSSAEEVAFHNSEVNGEEIYIVYKIEIGNLQEAGDYTNVITYICTPVF